MKYVSITKAGDRIEVEGSTVRAFYSDHSYEECTVGFLGRLLGVVTVEGKMKEFLAKCNSPVVSTSQEW